MQFTAGSWLGNSEQQYSLKWSGAAGLHPANFAGVWVSTAFKHARHVSYSLKLDNGQTALISSAQVLSYGGDGGVGGGGGPGNINGPFDRWHHPNHVRQHNIGKS